MALPIDYTFDGVGTGTLGGSSFSGTFVVTLDGDTTGITSGGGELQNIVSSANIPGGRIAGHVYRLE